MSVEPRQIEALVIFLFIISVFFMYVLISFQKAICHFEYLKKHNDSYKNIDNYWSFYWKNLDIKMQFLSLPFMPSKKTELDDELYLQVRKYFVLQLILIVLGISGFVYIVFNGN